MHTLVVFSGAGLSAESGLATFRDNNGLWANYDPMDVCNFQNWEHNFELVHTFYNMRRKELENVKPNAMHEFLASLESILAHKVRIIHLTQNVDDLLERAGAKHIIHLHGNLTRIVCPKCEQIFDIGYTEFVPKPCVKCGFTKLKPYIVFFFEQAPLYKVMYEVLSTLGQDDAMLVIGTSGNVIDISGIIASIESYTHRIGLKILNNLEPSNMINELVFHRIIYSKASEAIPAIKDEIISFFRT